MADYRIPGEWMKENMVLSNDIDDETINKLGSFQMKEGDVLVTAYPKTGITWIQELVWLVYYKGDIAKAHSVPLTERCTYLEYKPSGVPSGLDLLEKESTPHIMKTHMKSEIFKKQIESRKVRVIVVIRNPKDTLVSLYHFYRMTANLGYFKGTWDDFFEIYKAKHLIYGDYFDWYSSWLPQCKDNFNVKLVKYEDMQRSMPDVINDLCLFLDKSLSEKQINDIMKHLSFDSMSRNGAVNCKNIPYFDFTVSSFLRKGIIGDWKNYFTREQSALVDKPYNDVIVSMGVKLEFE
ncbi:hypothetical protein LSH36_12g36031 [Paralvinella palmiformis]|uniref:Sulfotransferase domain-containing protein n=1 Tax=Paralvinella palmiformis TaxID=53620 RepID=A0AAD9KDJ7_9ANNE|nr:hypothetical protein LSH36_12g36031 [Paralvinella palmiformis]